MSGSNSLESCGSRLTPFQEFPNGPLVLLPVLVQVENLDDVNVQFGRGDVLECFQHGTEALVLDLGVTFTHHRNFFSGRTVRSRGACRIPRQSSTLASRDQNQDQVPGMPQRCSPHSAPHPSETGQRVPCSVPMARHRFGPNFSRVFIAAIFQELAWSLLIHLPGYLNELGATEALIGVLYAGSAVISLVFRPLLGRILDLTHRRTVLLVAGAMNIVVVLLLISTSAWGPYLWIVFLAQRTFQIALFTTMLTYGADSIPIGRRTQGLAIYGLSGLIPIAVGGLAGDLLIDMAGFNGLFLAAAASSITSWLVVWTLPVLPVRGRQPRRSFWAALVQKNMLPLWFVSLLFAVGLESLFTFARTYVVDRQIGTAGMFFAAYGVAAAVTRIAGGGFYDRVPHRPLLVSSIAAYGLGIGALALAQGVPLFLTAAIVTGTAHGASFPLLSSEVVNRARVSERGSAMSTFTAIFDIALLAGAPAVGLLIDGFSYLVAFSVAGAALVLGALVYGFWDRRMVAASAPFVAEEVLE